MIFDGHSRLLLGMTSCWCSRANWFTYLRPNLTMPRILSLIGIHQSSAQPNTRSCLSGAVMLMRERLKWWVCVGGFLRSITRYLWKTRKISFLVRHVFVAWFYVRYCEPIIFACEQCIILYTIKHVLLVLVFILQHPLTMHAYLKIV